MDATNTSFSKRLRAFRDLIKNVSDDNDRSSLEKLADHMAHVQDMRHKITHGMWDWDESNPEKLMTYSFRKPFIYEHPFDLKKLLKLADHIAELLFELSFPNGISEAHPILFSSRFPVIPAPFLSKEHNLDETPPP